MVSRVETIAVYLTGIGISGPLAQSAIVDPETFNLAAFLLYASPAFAGAAASVWFRMRQKQLRLREIPWAVFSAMVVAILFAKWAGGVVSGDAGPIIMFVIALIGQQLVEGVLDGGFTQAIMKRIRDTISGGEKK